MRYGACNQAHNAEVEIWAIFATRNSLKLHMMQKLFSTISNVRAINAKVVLADDGSSKRQAPIDQSPRHRHTRFPSLEAFGRRPRCKPHRLDRPSSETLHMSGSRLASFNQTVGALLELEGHVDAKCLLVVMGLQKNESHRDNPRPSYGDDCHLFHWEWSWGRRRSSESAAAACLRDW